jgi:phosphoserine phosphatase RsbU/P
MPTEAITVRQVMQPNPIIVQPTSTVGELLHFMNQERIGSVLVCDGEKLIGIFTERDLLRRVADAVIGWRNYPVTEWMTANPHTICPEAGWEDAVQMMTDRKVRHMPVIEDDRVVGLLSTRMLMARRAEHLNSEVAERTTAVQQANNALLARDQENQHNMRAAGRLQKMLLPQQPPRWSNIDFAIHYAPLDHLGGDYYDFAEPDKDHIGLFIADASGHSIPAALVAIMTRYAFADAARRSINPGEVLTRINQRLCGITEERFVTAFYGVLNRRTGIFRYANAGHPYPLHCEAATGVIKPLVAQGFLLGIVPEEIYQEREVQLNPSDRLCFFTDGLIEARNEIGELYGTDRLTRCLTRVDSNPTTDVAEILACMNRFIGKEPLTDDLTLVSCQLAGGG